MKISKTAQARFMLALAMLTLAIVIPTWPRVIFAVLCGINICIAASEMVTNED